MCKPGDGNKNKLLCNMIFLHLEATLLVAITDENGRKKYWCPGYEKESKYIINAPIT